MTEYRAVRTEYGQYKLQFLSTRSRWFLFCHRKISVWNDIPDIRWRYLGFLTKENSHYLANLGYGHQIKDLDVDAFKHFIKKYPNIDNYFTVFNEEHKRWIEEKQKDSEKPTIINL